ncbi:MAG: 2-oxoacid:acceptor oxidoreductase family protein [Clostridia bacterium]|nr:2-oxoacid:acceptor oxidoreductase family protein [Clostridia bacterium]
MNVLIAGFGGQGILFAGRFLAHIGLSDGLEVSWLPSYGPEMRGGTANCSVILSEERIGSPIVGRPDTLVVMNMPSLDKYEQSVLPGGMLITDSTLVSRKPERNDIAFHTVPATRLASENGISKLANMIITGMLLRQSGLCGLERAEQVMRGIIPEKRKDLIALNMRAIALGYAFQ